MQTDWIQTDDKGLTDVTGVDLEDEQGDTRNSTRIKLSNQ
jgi:hypothetical protein